MAQSGTVTCFIPEGHDTGFTLKWSIKKQNGADTIVNCTLSAGSKERYKRYILNGTISVIVNGQSLFNRSNYSFAVAEYAYGYTTTVASRAITLTRTMPTNSGELDISISYNGTTKVEVWNPVYGKPEPDFTPHSTYNLTHDISAHDAVTITSTTLSGVPAYITTVDWVVADNDPTIHYYYDRGSDVTAAKLEAAISFTGEQMDIAYREIPLEQTYYTFPLTDAERNALYCYAADKDTGTVRFYIRTTETAGEETKTYEKYIDKDVSFVDYKPVISKVTLYDTNEATIALTGGHDADGYPTIVKYMSDVYYKMDVELRKGASEVVGSYVQNGGRIEEGFLEGTFDNPTSNIFYFSVTDDRLATATKSYTFDQFYGNYIDYVKPTVNVKTGIITGDGDVTFTVSGEWFDGYFKYPYNENQLDIWYSITNSDGYYSGGGTGFTATGGTGNKYSETFTVSGLDYAKHHTISITVQDKLLSAKASTTAISRPLFYWSEDDFTFNVPVTVKEDIIINGQSLIDILRNGGLIE